MSLRRILIALFALAAIAATAVSVLRRPAEPSTEFVRTHALRDFTPPPPVAQPILRPELRDALGYGIAISWDRRLDTIRKVKNPTAEEAGALLTAMMAYCPPTVSASVHSSYMHEIACILQTRQDSQGKFACALATLARDTKRDGATRDYAIQHLRQVWSQSPKGTVLRPAIASTLRELLHLEPAIATSALLSLHVLGTPACEGYAADAGALLLSASSPDSRTSAYLPDADMVPLLKPILSGTSTKEASAKVFPDNMAARLTAIRIAGERRMKDYREPLLAALKDPAEHMMIRMAAANAIGAIADPADLESLSTFEPGNEQVAAALRLAIRHRTTR